MQQNLKQKTIGGRSVVLLRVPARDARHIQVQIAALLARPAAKLGKIELGEQKLEDVIKDKAKMMSFAGFGIEAFADLLEQLSEQEFDKLIDKIAPFIRIDGDPFSENDHFDVDTLFEMYQVIWFFLEGTFSSFFGGLSSRLPQIDKLKELIQSKAPTSTGTSGDPA